MYTTIGGPQCSIQSSVISSIYERFSYLFQSLGEQPVCGRYTIVYVKGYSLTEIQKLMQTEIVHCK